MVVVVGRYKDAGEINETQTRIRFREERQKLRNTRERPNLSRLVRLIVCELIVTSHCLSHWIALVILLSSSTFVSLGQ